MQKWGLDNEAVEALFAHKNGYRFARWARPIAPIVFGVDDATLGAMKLAMATTIGVAGLTLSETDPELGSNFMWFFCRNWDEIDDVPDLDKLVPDLKGTIKQLKDRNLNTHRIFAFDEAGAIKLCVVFIRINKALEDVPVQVLTTSETFFALALWAPDAFGDVNPVALIAENNLCVVKPDYAVVLRALYDRTMPDTAEDASHALRVSARAQMLFDEMENDA